MVMFDSTPSNVGLQAPEKAGPPAESQAASPQPSTEPQPRARTAAGARAAQPSHTEPPQPSPPSRPSRAGAGADAADLRVLRAAGAASRRPRRPRATSPSRRRRTRRPGRRSARSRCRPPGAAGAATAGRPRRPRPCPSPLPGPDPGDVLIGQGRQRNDYLSRVVSPDSRAIASIRASAANNNQGGRVVTRVTIGARRPADRCQDRDVERLAGHRRRRARDHPQGRALPAGAERHAGRSGGPDPADDLQPARRARALRRQAKSRASAWRTAGGITAMWP